MPSRLEPEILIAPSSPTPSQQTAPLRPSAIAPGTGAAERWPETADACAPGGAAAAPGAIEPRAKAQKQAAIAEALVAQGRLAEAIGYYLAAVRVEPTSAEYCYHLAITASLAGRAELVGPHLQQAVRLEPDHVFAHDALGMWHLERGNLQLSLLHSRRAMELAPTDPRMITAHAMALQASGAARAAWDLAEPLLAAGIRYFRLAMLYARLAPQLKQELPALSVTFQIINHPQTSLHERSWLHFTAAALLDRMGRYDQAFEHAKAAHELCRHPYDPQLTSRAVDQQIAYFTPRRYYALPRAIHGNRRPVFIVGMPRSGTSLVEQILASHPDVYGAGELDLLDALAGSAAAADTAYPHCLDAIHLRHANALAGQYLTAIAQQNTTATYVTDKMPVNFQFLGLMGLLFPDCHVIHCVRDPRDTCLSCYFTPFSTGHKFAHDLRHLALFYRDYHRLMQHWKHEMCLPMLHVQYEDVVQDLEGQTRRMLGFLDLSWNDNCLKFYNNNRFVASASRDQVRQPLYNASIGRWKRYQAQLSPLLETLHEVLCEE